MSTDRKEFLKALGGQLFPRLREAGFNGSGSTLRRINEPVVHVFNVQGSYGRGGCYINLGAHLSMLQDPAGGASASSTIEEASCMFRSRFAPEINIFESDDLWPYGNNEHDRKLSVDHMIDRWQEDGEKFFNQYQNYPGSFSTVLHELDVQQTSPGRLADFVQLAIVLGEHDQARTMIAEATARCSERAVGLKSRLETFSRDLSEK